MAARIGAAHTLAQRTQSALVTPGRGRFAMALDRSNFQLFGLDLYRLYLLGQQAAADLGRTAWLQRLLPLAVLTVHLPDGSQRLLRADGLPAPAGAARSAGDAVVLPAELVLAGQLRLPATASDEDCARAVEFAVAADSPFAAGDSLSAWQLEEIAGGTLVHYLIVSRHQVDRWLASQPRPAGCEVWAAAGERLLVLPGYGENKRQATRRRQGWTALALLALVLVLALALAAVPALQRRQQVFAAQNEFNALSARSATVVQARGELGALNLRLTALAEAAAALPPPTGLLLHLTELLPDSAHLLQFNSSGSQFTLRGTALNASALVEELAQAPGFSEVRPASAIVRNAVTGRETFIIQGRYLPPAAAAQVPA